MAPITLWRCTPNQQKEAQAVVTEHHYLHRPVDVRCSLLTYQVVLDSETKPAQCIGYLMFGRTESTRCFDGGLTYGGLDDISSGRAQYSRWEILNLARVWLSPAVQQGGPLYSPDLLPGYTDRRGIWRSTLASHVVKMALHRIAFDYLMTFPPCFPDEPWQLRECLSYCDTKLHRGTIYRAAGFRLVRENKQGIQTWANALRFLNQIEREKVLDASS